MSEYPNQVPRGVTPEYQQQYAKRYHKSEQPAYWTLARLLVSAGWTPIASPNRQVEWAITMAGEPVETTRPVTLSDWGDYLDASIPDNLVICTVTQGMEVTVTSEVHTPSFPLPNKPGFALQVPRLLQNPELLDTELVNALEHDNFDSSNIESLLYVTSRLPDAVTLNVLTTEHLFPTGRLVALKIGSPHILIQALQQAVTNDSTITTFTELYNALTKRNIVVPAEQIFVYADPNKTSVREGLRHVRQPIIAMLVPHSQASTVEMICEMLPDANMIAPSLQDALAAHPHTPSDYLWALACHPDAQLRKIVAGNHGATPRIRTVATITNSV